MGNSSHFQGSEPRQTAIAKLGLQAGLLWCAVALLTTGCVERTPKKKRGRRQRQLTPADRAIIKKNILKKAPEELTKPVDVELGEKAVYLGADIAGTVEPGKPFRVTHYWKVKEKLPGWRLFTHLNGPGGKVSFINVDHIAIGGRYPVTKWEPGQIIRDRQTVTLPANWPHPAVEIYTGIWKPGKGRLDVAKEKSDGDNRVLVGRLKVGKTYRNGAVEPDGSARKPAGEPPKRYVVRKITSEIEIDGKGDEAAWKEAASTGPFVETRAGRSSPVRTEAKLLYDDKNLYVLFLNADSDIWSTIKKKDAALWTQEVVEIMIDPDGDGATYVELQVSPNGTIFDAYLPRRRQAQTGWDSSMKAEVRVEGTLNERDDQDKGWTVEIALPLKSAFGRTQPAGDIPPEVGTVWRANMFRMDFPKGKPRRAVAWSPPLTGDFHTLDRFGALVFGDLEGKVEKRAPEQEGAASEEKGAPEARGKGEGETKPEKGASKKSDERKKARPRG